MDLNDFKVLGKLIEKEFEISFIGLSRMDGYPMFNAIDIPEFLKNNFEYEFVDGCLKLVNIFHEHLECLREIKNLHEKIEKLNEILDDSNFTNSNIAYAEYIAKNLKILER